MQVFSTKSPEKNYFYRVFDFAPPHHTHNSTYQSDIILYLHGNKQTESKIFKKIIKLYLNINAVILTAILSKVKTIGKKCKIYAFWAQNVENGQTKLKICNKNHKSTSQHKMWSFLSVYCQFWKKIQKKMFLRQNFS